MTREYKIVEHRPTYKRVVVGSEPVAKSTGVAAPAPDRVDANAKRLWRTVVQSAQGGVAPPEPEPQPEPNPVRGNVYVSEGNIRGVAPAEPEPSTVYDGYGHIGDVYGW